MVDYSRQINPMEVAAFIQQGAEQGRQRGETMYANRLLGEAYNAQGPARQSALAKLAGTQPQVAMQAETAFGAQDEAKQKRQADLLAQGAEWMSKMTPEQRAQAWPTFRQRASVVDAELAAMLPEQYDDAQIAPFIQQIAGADGGAKIHSQRVLADGRILNTYADGRTEVTDHVADRQSWFANYPGVDPYIVRESGDVTMVGPGGQPSQPRTSAQPAFAGSGGDPKADSIMQAMNAMIAAGVPAAEVEAFGQRAMQAAGMQPTAGGQMPPQPAPAPAGGDISRVPINEYGGGPVGGNNPLRRPAATAGEESFGQPQPVTDPQTGQVKMVQFGNRGSMREVSNYAPPPTARDAKPPTEGERGAAGYLSRMQEAEKLLEGFTSKGYEAGNMRDYMTAGQGPLLNWAASDTGQQYRQAQEDWVRAKLRKESGAVIGDEEMAREIKVYFPQPGDGPEVIAQKKTSRAEAINQLRTMGGRAVQQSPKGAPARLKFNPETGELE